MDSTWCLCVDVRRETTGEGEGLDEALETLSGHGVLGVEAGDASLHVESGKEGRRSVTRTCDEQNERSSRLVLFVVLDQVVCVGVCKVESGAGSPVAEETLLDVILGELASEESVGAKKDLDGQSGR